MNTAFTHVQAKARWAVLWAAIGAPLTYVLFSFESHAWQYSYLHVAAVGATCGAFGAGVLAGGRIGWIGWFMMTGCFAAVFLCLYLHEPRKGGFVEPEFVLATVASGISIGFTIGASLELLLSRDGTPHPAPRDPNS